MSAPVPHGDSGRVRGAGSRSTRADARAGRETGTGLRGAASYTGPQLYCTRWQDHYDLTGLHVAVIGSGEAVARVLPAVTHRARKVTVFQHDPVWVLPWTPLPGARQLVRSLPEDLLGLLEVDTAPPLPGDARPQPAGDVARAHARQRPGGEVRQSLVGRAVLELVGGAVRDLVGGVRGGGGSSRPVEVVVYRLSGAVLRRAAAANLRAQVRDSWRRRQLTPDTAAGIRLHNHYYRALERPSCRLVTWPIARLAPLGIRTVDGVEHRVDCIIYAEDMA
ncbi:hypothetical protein AB0N05_23315 [Nocardia sp. NPDC051030]|uniref:hypothetical protein n=1 Tax=Nocardia sp. NPDC051030 TaxID=3155162 RepID=UPI00342A2D1B